MSESATEREMKAVHSENKKNLQADGWRFQQLIRSSANPQHPFHQFSTGNLDTLDVKPKAQGINTRDELLRFHAKYYSANLMRVTVLGKESLDTLEEWVRECFEPVENKNLKPASFAPLKVFEKEQLARSMNVYVSKFTPQTRTTFS
jgi:insulysin